MKIAISLLTHNDEYLLKPALDSLLASDISDYYFKLFCYDNNSTVSTIDFLEDYKIDKWV